MTKLLEWQKTQSGWEAQSRLTSAKVEPWHIKCWRIAVEPDGLFVIAGSSTQLLAILDDVCDYPCPTRFESFCEAVSYCEKVEEHIHMAQEDPQLVWAITKLRDCKLWEARSRYLDPGTGIIQTWRVHSEPDGCFSFERTSPALLDVAKLHNGFERCMRGYTTLASAQRTCKYYESIARTIDQTNLTPIEPPQLGDYWLVRSGAPVRVHAYNLNTGTLDVVFIRTRSVREVTLDGRYIPPADLAYTSSLDLVARSVSPDRLVRLWIGKFGGLYSGDTVVTCDNGVPRTPSEWEEYGNGYIREGTFFVPRLHGDANDATPA